MQHIIDPATVTLTSDKLTEFEPATSELLPSRIAKEHPVNIGILIGTILLLVAAGCAPKASSPYSPDGIATSTTHDSKRNVSAYEFYQLCKNGTYSQIEKAITNGAEVNKIVSSTVVTPLTAAAGYNSDPEIIKLLVDAGARVNEKNKSGETALMIAAKRNTNPKIITTLIAAGAYMSLVSDAGMTIVDLAHRNDNSEVLETVVRARRHSKATTLHDRHSESQTPEAERTELRRYYVKNISVKVRLSPDSNGKITNTIYRRQAVDVMELQNGWARVSDYYDGQIEGKSGNLARWIPYNSLAKKRPQKLKLRKFMVEKPHRIDGIPKVGQHGLTERDVQILYAAAKYYLETGKASQIVYGDKSVKRPGIYYLNFNNTNENHFFSPEDIPNLDQRIRDLEK